MAETFAQLLHKFRTRRALTKVELAEALGTHRQSLLDWEAGRRVPRDRARLEDLVQVLHLAPAEAEQLIAAARRHTSPRPGAAPVAEANEPAATAPEAQHFPANSSRHQLRTPIADFVGHAKTIMTLSDTLRRAGTQGRVAAISGVQGMGGIGKTELAYLVANNLIDSFPDAQIVVSLRGTSTAPLTPTQAMRQVIHAFTPDARLPDDLEVVQGHYRSVLHQQRALILADDARDAAQVRPLLPPAGCALLVTSRQRFSLPGMTTIDLEVLSEPAAVALLGRLCTRLRGVEARQLARACGYLPLALRISGSLLHNNPALDVTTYLGRLANEQQRLAQLRDPDDPQLDVAATLALSYAQLEDPAQRVFRQLGALVTDFTTELARAVVALPEGVDIVMSLHGLLRHNLIMYDLVRDRWRLHDLVRDLARHELEQQGETEATHWRYAQAAVQIAQATQDQYLAGGDGMLDALARFDIEQPHIDASRRWAIQAGTPEGDRLLLDFARTTLDIGDIRYNPQHERFPQWESALAAARRLGDQYMEEFTLANLGNAYIDVGDARHAIPYLEQALSIARAIGNQLSEGRILNSLAHAHASLGDARQAIYYCEQSLAIARALGERRGEGLILCNLGIIYTELGDAPRAIHYYEEALIIIRELGDQRSEGKILGNLGNAYMDLGDARRALTSFEQQLTLAHAFGDRRSEGTALHNLGKTCTILGDIPRALEACAGSRAIARELGDQRMESYALSYLAFTHAQQGDRTQATTTFEQAMALFREVGDRDGIAEGQWQFGLALLQHGERAHALPLLRDALAYEQEINHGKAAEHAGLLAQLEAQEELPKDLLDNESIPYE